MANRHLSRSIAMQALFEFDFFGGVTKKAPEAAKRKEMEEILERAIDEFGPGLDDGSFAKKLALGVVDHQKEIDDIIEKAAPEWPIQQIAPVDRNVLRVGLFELLYGEIKEVPPKVAINESIELAKSFGGDSSGKFVNGVLGTVYRELGEPGKDDKGKKEYDNIDKLPKEELVGAVVARHDAKSKETMLALVHDVFGFWTFTKGHLEKGEDIEDGAVRKIKEELGVKKVKINKKIGENEYIASDPKTGPTRRHVSFFLAETSDTVLKLSSSGGLDDARWFDTEEVYELKMYPDIKHVLETAIEELKKII
ncbi:MAG: N utilization substance protein B-like protein [Candidatus Giovannonibacteria bacterium GW2011_GWA2_44_13b]|uniref:Transcription antitermination protein NusB n=2 Tax=Candidatus Giovannoniibacteriota TaxID=1752738 RepID=A0A0G1JBW9_9BACT|nr:MAG: N utilization substance protein B-like protein [Candidatus Giovannonibacteria bacterium GW2011_GWA2_44_13b]